MRRPWVPAHQGPKPPGFDQRGAIELQRGHGGSDSSVRPPLFVFGQAGLEEISNIAPVANVPAVNVKKVQDADISISIEIKK